MAPGRTSRASSPARNSENGAGDNSGALWNIVDIPGKGKGIIVTQDIKPGILLLSEEPLIKTDVVTSFDMNVTEQDLERALKTKSPAEQENFRSLHNNFKEEDPKHPLSGIIRSNAYPLGAGADVGGVFPDISRINHSCLPNSVQYWNPLLEQQTIYAVRPIPKGEEITTSYLAGGPSTERKQMLKEHFKFDCTCELCSLPPNELQASDARLLRAEQLDEIIGDSKKVHYSPEEVMKSCRALYDIYTLEGVKDGRLSRLYYDAFQMCNMHSDLARAKCFAKYYSDAKKMAEGADSLNVAEMKMFIKAPQKHDSFGATERWKTSTGDIPKGLKPIAFANWMWRKDV